MMATTGLRRDAARSDEVKPAAWTGHGEMALVRSDRSALMFLYVFAANAFAVGCVHALLLDTPARFVQAPDEARPDDARVLRLVRVFDCLVNLLHSAQLFWCARALRRGSLSLAAARWYVIAGCAVMAGGYLVGAGVDYLQCHFQASGIGPECSGLRCIYTASSVMGLAIFCGLFPRWLFVATFCAQGLYRMEWIRKLEDFLPLSVQTGVAGLALCIFMLPLACYAHERAQFLLGKQRDVRTGAAKERDLESDMSGSEALEKLPAQPTCSALAQVARSQEELQIADNISVSRVKVDDARAGVAAFAMEPATLCVQAQPDIPQRVKEDDARVGTSPVSSETTSSPQATPLPEPDSPNESVPTTASSIGSCRVSSPLGKRGKRPAAKISEHKADECVSNTSDRKRRRREVQKTLVAKLDLLLPEGARRGGFKGAGPRSAGVWGRSFFNVISDTIAHLRDKGLGDPDNTAPSPLMTLGLNYRDLIMSSSTSIALEVGVDASGQLLLRDLSVGARDWFRGAPWPVCAYSHVRDLVDVEDWSVMEQLRDSLRKAATSAPTAAMMNKRQRKVRLAHFSACEYQPDVIGEGKETAPVASTRYIDVVEYVDATMSVSCFPEIRVPGKGKPEAVARATIIFDIPDSWQWVQDTVPTDASVMARTDIGDERPQTRGRWRNVMDDASGSASKPTLEDLIGGAHEYMGVYKLSRQKSRGLSSFETSTGGLQGLEGIATFLQDPSSLMKAKDKAVLQSFLASLTGSIDVHRLHQMWSCVELHSGIAATGQGDALALFYRLKLPCKLGGYESTWTPLTMHKLSRCAQPTESTPGKTVCVIPRRYRGQSAVGLEVLELGADGTGRLGVHQHMQFKKTSDGRGAILQGLFSASGSPQLGKFSLVANKVDQGNKALFDMEARIDTSPEGLEQVMADSFLHCSNVPALFEEDQVSRICSDEIAQLFEEDDDLDLGFSTESSSTFHGNKSSWVSSPLSCEIDVTSPESTGSAG